jgi:protein Tex
VLLPLEHRLAQELACKLEQISSAVALLDEGASVPFISRYRKEATGGLDDTQLRTLEERLGYLRELEQRRTAVLASIEEQGKLTPELRTAIEHAEARQRLEDLYLPFRPKRRTKAQIAREAGLEPLARTLLANPMLNPEQEAERFLRPAFIGADGENPGVIDVKAALEGARQILSEQFGENAELLARLREHLQTQARVVSAVIPGKEQLGEKFRDYFAYRERVKDIPSHRALALFRGRNEAVLRIALRLPEELDEADKSADLNTCEQMIARRFGIASQARVADAWLIDAVRHAWRARMAPSLESQVLGELRERAEEEAIRVFARNLHDLLLASPAGPRTTIGLDPGLRTGVKAAVVDRTGRLVDAATIYPHAPRNDRGGSLEILAALVKKHDAELISIGNGTASRETDRLAADLIKQHPGLKLAKIVVSEAGASVYSASALAAKEFPELDVSLRGAVSIARRLQDPLAELVKIDAKAIGVGQYQHDVNQSKLAKSLDAVVEDCVNAVGVDVNTASVPLLTRVSGLSNAVAENIVRHRDTHGAFANRAALKSVPRMGAKSFEQAAGFLRIMNGDNPLDASAVHPEAYPVVERILADLANKLLRASAARSVPASGGKAEVFALIGNVELLKSLDPLKYTDGQFGLPTVRDILQELERPGRDPRPEFKTAAFREGIDNLKDLQPGMLLEGVVTNVANFGAFVDIGVHQDGLVHISALAHKFVKDPREVVKAGDVVKVKVLEIDEKRRRVALTMKLEERSAPAPRETPASKERAPARPNPGKPAQSRQPESSGAMADALKQALNKSRGG